MSAQVEGKMNDSLRSLARDITTLKKDTGNVRMHGETSVHAIMSSLQHFGQQKPVVALKSGKVIAGNGTLEAARRLGWKQIAAVLFDDDDERAAKAYAIADNRTAELSDWDEDLLAEQLREMKEGVDFEPMHFEQIVVIDEEAQKAAVQKQIQEILDAPETAGFWITLTTDQAHDLREALKSAKTRCENPDESGVSEALTQMCKEYMEYMEAVND